MILSRYEFYHCSALRDVADFTRDAEFDESDVAFAPGDAVLSITIYQYLYQLSRYRKENVLLWHRAIPCCRCSLTFRSVVAYTVQRDAQLTIARHSLGSIEYYCSDRKSILLVTHEGTTLDLTVEDFVGDLEVTDEEDVGRLRSGLTIFSGRRCH